ncbi:hypothetical protein [Aequorivita marina]|uniref:hypothetical protein n=1 Tax=Aequorivita marina TaxID=3073654 RepID=UPI0028751F16|nr:hypothetical protein [Aequorivita sp. S2608]MDS1297168.1 hypothetical protein [Aequorivita sp. S2608]
MRKLLSIYKDGIIKTILSDCLNLHTSKKLIPVAVLYDTKTCWIKPNEQVKMKFHRTITEFREKLAKREEGGLTRADIDAFYNTINNFNFNYVFFADYYRKYIENLNRFRPNTDEENPDVTFLLIAIAEDQWKPTKPYDVFLHYMRYTNKLTSRFFISHQKKQNRKKIDASEAQHKKESKFDSSKKWTRIPTRQNQCKPNCGCSE